ncbi:flavin reductase family protein [Desulfurobacterium atlanticum]|uniref:NADH-FMN oxidoreductase RutF, flavin reductase (DIM6/NTAB) family n=1 Tax=Desulfurobacterium atlanticum TaxID=240169 RepID=A0A239AC28_9BACT|nr:flavin reductase family protein [Desulfurobacterium atlanticum]SNR93150.1 NADH-FMN oxidoreductase RutF, flavin reductase (DIM6/NTAB) family [Desulfurobacterium atlanticum]
MKKADVKSADQSLISKLIFNTVAPRPIAWITTLNENGSVNLAPFSFYNAITTKPPLLFVSIGKRKDGSDKDTIRNIKRTGEFVINVISKKFFESMVESGKDFPPEESEIEKLQIETVPSETVSPPIVKGVPAALECKVKEIIELGATPMSVVIGEVVFIHYDEEILKTQKGIVGRLGGKRYIVVEKEITIFK